MSTFFFLVNAKRSKGRSILHHGLYPMDTIPISRVLETKEKRGRYLIIVHPGNFIFIFFIPQKVSKPTL